MTPRTPPPSPLPASLQRWVAELQRRDMGPLAVFLLRAHLPLTGFMAHALMFSEPFLTMLNLQARPLYELLNDRDAVRRLIYTLEQHE